MWFVSVVAMVVCRGKRKKHFEEKSLYSLFRNVIPDVIFDFLREIGVFYKI